MKRCKNNNNRQDKEILKFGFILTRTPKGTVTNFKQAIVRHSPDGFEWGYGGSGPADTALNILYHTARLKKIDVDIEIMYEDFKREFIAPLNRELGTQVIRIEDVVSFIKGYQTRQSPAADECRA